MTPAHNATAPRGFSIMEIMIAVSIILVLAAIEIPNLLRARIAANQAAAVASLRTIEAAEITYAVTYNRGYTSSLAQLGPAQGPSSSEGADLIDSLTARGQKGGYSYVYIPGPVVDGKVDTYTLHAVPSAPCSTGFEYYSVGSPDQSSITSESFHSAVQNDIIAEVLLGSLGRESVTCSQ
jgi:type IV pilus assembly protein PilA